MQLTIVFLVLLLNIFGCQSHGFGPGKQNYGYVDVRPGAHLFWWLYYTTASDERPLMIWLSGGPGTSSTSFGNFGSIGPWDGFEFRPRKNSWIKDFNLLFIDNPVGAGYSYADDISLMPRNSREIAMDLIVLLKEFYEIEPKFKTLPLYLFSSSYGSKYVLPLTELLHKDDNFKHILKGVALSSPWIYPIFYYSTYGQYMFNAGIVDKDGYKEIQKRYFRVYLNYKMFGPIKRVGVMAEDLTDFIEELASDIIATNFRKITVRMAVRQARFNSHPYMDGIVRWSLNINNSVPYGSQSGDIMDILYNLDSLTPDIHIVEGLLNNTDIKIYIINGNDDLLTSTPGQLKWLKIMNWNDAEEYKKAKRAPLFVNNILQGYYKKTPKFAYFWINDSGHFPASQNPEGCREAVRMMTGI